LNTYNFSGSATLRNGAELSKYNRRDISRNFNKTTVLSLPPTNSQRSNPTEIRTISESVDLWLAPWHSPRSDEYFVAATTALTSRGSQGVEDTSLGRVHGRQIPAQLPKRGVLIGNLIWRSFIQTRHGHAIRRSPRISSLDRVPLSLPAAYPKGITFPLGSCLSGTNSRNSRRLLLAEQRFFSVKVFISGLAESSYRSLCDC